MIWIVTSPERIHGEAAYLNALTDAGPVTLLLRKPHWDLHAYASLLEQLHDHSKVMITAYPELLLRYPVMGLHVSEGRREAVMGLFRREQMLKSAGQCTTKLPDSEGARGAEGACTVEHPERSGRTPELQPPAPHPVLSTSIHTPHSPGEQWQYLLLGPVFDSISKTGYSGKGHLFQTVPPNSIAIGGVQASNIAKVKAMGFCGAALLGAIWQNPAGAVKNYQIIQQLWQHS